MDPLYDWRPYIAGATGFLSAMAFARVVLLPRYKRAWIEETAYRAISVSRVLNENKKITNGELSVVRSICRSISDGETNKEAEYEAIKAVDGEGKYRHLFVYENPPEEEAE